MDFQPEKLKQYEKEYLIFTDKDKFAGGIDYDFFDNVTFEKKYAIKYKIKIIGDVQFKHNKNSQEKKLVLEKNDKKHQYNISDYNEKRKIIGYIKVGENDFVRIIEPPQRKIIHLFVAITFVISVIYNLITKKEYSLFNYNIQDDLYSSINQDYSIVKS